jgi:hypothetical protein
MQSVTRFLPIKPLRYQTYHNIHGPGPRAHASISLNKKVGLGFTDNLGEFGEFPSISGRTTNVLQLEDDLDDLSDRLDRISSARTEVETDTIEIVRRYRSMRVNSGRIRELRRLTGV